MKRNLLLGLTLGVTLTVSAQSPENFKPYAASDLRLPSVPLVVNDPYFSIWSPYDKLNEGTTKHWTNADKPLLGLLRVDGQTYRFMGSNERSLMETLAPMGNETAWTARILRNKPNDGWQMPEFDYNGWHRAKGAFGDDVRRDVQTYFGSDNTDLYARREIDLTKDQLKGEIILQYSHDDVCEIYINGTKVVDTGLNWKRNVQVVLDDAQKALLKPGNNLIAAHCHNTTGGAYLDFGLYRKVTQSIPSIKAAEQKSVDVLACNTYYSFGCGPVDLDLVFTAPMIYDDLDLLSTPINYISYQVHATDKKKHSVEFYLATTPEIGMDNVGKGLKPAETSIVEQNGITYAKAGTIAQPILERKGDGVCIDWGYIYLPNVNGEVSIAPYKDMQQEFVNKGNLAKGSKDIVSQGSNDLPALAYIHKFQAVDKSPQSSFTMLGYDEVEDIEYLYHRYKAYWAHEGKVSIFDAFNKMNADYAKIMADCYNIDRIIYEDGLKAGDKKYAEILSSAYRHVIAAHKLFQDKDGNLLFFSKENNSNGSVNTVDLTYPSAPLFLCYNHELQKAMMTSIFEYSKSGRWTKPFAAHDMGTYPIANGQTYTGDMPLEESGNMIILATTISMLDGNTNYANKYWDILTTWANYLVENGQDPTNQLCTDDFAGHWAHNCNLSIKAIMGIMGYAKMALMRGDAETSTKYENIAKRMAATWERDANEGDHYRLAFDRDNTWSQKYNMIWDKIWKTNIFPNNAMQTEVKYYLTKMNRYGLPLDCRKDYTKSDWIMWTASMAQDKGDFLKLEAPIYTFINETSSRVPQSDWYDTKTAKYQAFIARSVIGGFWMKVFEEITPYLK